MNLLGKKIVATTVEDSRWPAGESVEDSFKSNYAFGVSMKLFFDDNTYAYITSAPTPEGDSIIGMKVGTYRVDEENQIQVVT